MLLRRFSRQLLTPIESEAILNLDRGALQSTIDLYLGRSEQISLTKVNTKGVDALDLLSKHDLSRLD
jgi:hypothetical protein